MRQKTVLLVAKPKQTVCSVPRVGNGIKYAPELFTHVGQLNMGNDLRHNKATMWIIKIYTDVFVQRRHPDVFVQIRGDVFGRGQDPGVCVEYPEFVQASEFIQVSYNVLPIGNSKLFSIVPICLYFMDLVLC